MKFDPSMEQVWALDFAGRTVNDLAVTPGGEITAILDGGTLIVISVDGSITEEHNIAVDTWSAEKLLCDSSGNSFVVYTKPMNGVIIRKYDTAGSPAGETQIISGSTMAFCTLKNNSLFVMCGGSGFIRIVKLDLNLALQWTYDRTFTGDCTAGSMDSDSAGNVYFTGEAPATDIAGAGTGSRCCFIAKTDRFGNESWIKVINGADFITLPTDNIYYLPSKKLAPLVSAGSDDTIKVISGINGNKTVPVSYEIQSICSLTDPVTGIVYSYICGTDTDETTQVITAGSMVIRRYNSGGGLESINTVQSYNGTFYCDGIFTDSNGSLNIYGSTTGRLFENGMNAGMLDWFYARLAY